MEEQDEAYVKDGYFIGPTIFDHVKPNMTIWKEEIFAPVYINCSEETWKKQ